MLRRLWRFLLGPAPTPPLRVRDLFERQDALEGEVSGLRTRVKTLEGQMSGGMRGNRRKETVEDPLQTTIETPPLSQDPPRFSPEWWAQRRVKGVQWRSAS